MTTYVKSNNVLYKDTPLGKVYVSMPSDLSNISEGEIVFIENSGVFQKMSNQLIPLVEGSSGVASNNVGELLVYPSSTNPDLDHFLLCDGSTFDSSEYPELYTVLGTDVLPNFTNKYLRGDGSNSNISSHDTINVLESQSDKTPYHLHKIVDPGHTHAINDGTHRHSFYGRTATDFKASNVTQISGNGITTAANTNSSTGETGFTFGKEYIGNMITVRQPSTDSDYGTPRTSSGSITQKAKEECIYIRAKE